eukprot:CAMPEP_0203874014 /NCGR_PEP_ID=MMETSP0359-20131031/20047_1 /ASSEMBLY_ACC=CAM_ASM_000338 /TAXON_ID=268821 /ORGANISM="Scrippsiella Hangoei, Strain SHTV-5" /LENGTH=104 /DNA_ID=CAMNT_0050792729 /DNA_START=66 /DNA_END=376 /DNA_ORIENTATION=-
MPSKMASVALAGAAAYCTTTAFVTPSGQTSERATQQTRSLRQQSSQPHTQSQAAAPLAALALGAAGAAACAATAKAGKRQARAKVVRAAVAEKVFAKMPATVKP